MKKLVKSTLILTLSLILALSLFSCKKDDKEITSVSIATGSVASELFVGETLDTSGLKLVVSYKDGSAETIGADKLEIGKIDTTTPGEKTLTVKYEGFSATVKINVKDNTPVTVKTVKIVAGSYPASVKIGDSLDLSGIRAEVTYTDGAVKIVSASELTVSAIDTGAAGDKTLTVSYEGVSDTATVKVIGVSALTVVTGTLPKEVAVGTPFDASRAKALAVFDGGETLTVSSPDLKVGTLDTSAIGDFTVEVSYKGFTLEWSVKVVGVTEIEIIESSIPTSVRVGSTPDFSGIQVKATYNNGNEDVLTASELTISPISADTTGVKTLTVTYGTLTATANITVVGVKNMTPMTGTYPEEILVNGQIDLTNLAISVEYTDGTSAMIGIADLKEYILPDVTSKGTKAIAVKYLDGTAEISVRICGIEKLVIEGIAKTVVAGETLDLTNMVVKLVYSDTNATSIIVTDYTTNIAELNFDEEGDKIFRVNYNGEYGTFEGTRTISTTPPVLEGLVITSYPLYVELGGAYDKTLVRAKALFGNGDEEDVSALITVSDISTATAGKITLTVTYTEDGVTVTATAEVSVLPITKLDVSGIPATVKLGETVNYDLVKTTATFSDGTYTVTKEVTATVTPADLSSAGAKTVVVSYLGSSANVTLTVIAPVTIKPLTGTYDAGLREGYTPSAAGLKLEVVYTDGSKEIVSAAGNEKISYSYVTEGGKTYFKVEAYGLSYSAQVKTITIKEVTALNGTVPTTILVGTPAPTDMKLTVIYVDDEGNEYVYLIGAEDPALTITPIDTSSAGEKAVIFTFAGKTSLVIVTVRGVESIEVVGGTLNNVVFVGDTLDTSDILIKVVFTDLTYIYADTTDINLTIGTIDTSSVGTKQLAITYRDKTVYFDVKVDNQSGITGDIYGIELPASIVARNTYKNNFKDSTYVYFVGDDNPYIFYLNVLVLDKNYELVDVDGKTVATTSRIFLINDDGSETELTGDALAAMVVKNDDQNTYDFTEAAIGKTFRLEAKPRDNYSSSATKSHTVKVVDGYNIYSAKELNIITNTEHDLNGGSGEGYLNQLTLVNDFLAKNGITRPDNLAGIILHGNISVTPEDLPPEYVLTYTKNGVEKQGIYDWEYVFYHTNGINGAAPHFTMYGNYYSIYSYAIPCVVEEGIANNDDAFSSSSFFRFNAGPIVNGFNHKNYSTTILGVAFRDNDPNSNDQAASERHMRGLSCLKTSYQVVNVTNTNVDAYTISMVPEDDDLTVNLDKVKFYNAWQGHLFIWNINTVQEDLGTYNEAPRAEHQNIKINITDSLLAKCGGPVILSQNKDPNYAANAESGADIVVDDKSEIYSYVTGQEAWFVAVGQTPLAAQIMAMDQLIAGTSQMMGLTSSYTSDQKIAGVNTVNMIYVNMGIGSDITGGEKYRGTFTRAGVTLNNMTSNPIVETYVAAIKAQTGQEPPVFQSSAGGTAFSDGATGCYGIDFTTGAMGLPAPEFFMGDYISLYYMGVGLLLDYYH